MKFEDKLKIILSLGENDNELIFWVLIDYIVLSLCKKYKSKLNMIKYKLILK